MGRPPRPAFHPRLAEHRRRRGLSQARTAEEIERLAIEHEGVRVAISANTVARHERGEQWSTDTYRRLYCRLYKATEQQLGLCLSAASAVVVEADTGASDGHEGDEANRHKFPHTRGTLGTGRQHAPGTGSSDDVSAEAPRGATTDTAVLPLMIAGRVALVPIDRRALLAGGAATMLATTAPATIWRSKRSAHVDPRAVAHLLELRSALVRSDSLLGPRRLLRTGVEQLLGVEELLDAASGGMRSQLLTVGALYAEFAGWLFDDAGQPHVGSHWTDHVLEWADAAASEEVRSYVLMRKGQQAALAGKAALTIGLSHAAQRQGGATTPAIRAAAAQQEAHGHALDGDETTCLAKLDEAQSLHEQSQSCQSIRIGRPLHAYLHPSATRHLLVGPWQAGPRCSGVR